MASQDYFWSCAKYPNKLFLAIQYFHVKSALKILWYRPKNNRFCCSKASYIPKIFRPKYMECTLKTQGTRLDDVYIIVNEEGIQSMVWMKVQTFDKKRGTYNLHYDFLSKQKQNRTFIKIKIEKHKLRWESGCTFEVHSRYQGQIAHSRFRPCTLNVIEKSNYTHVIEKSHTLKTWPLLSKF